MIWFRVLVAVLIAICLALAPALLYHSSADGVILGRYTPAYFALLVVYALALVGLAALGGLAGPGVRDFVLRPIYWLRHRWLLVVVLLYGFVEIWYLVRRVLPQAHFFFGRDLTTILIVVALIELYAAGVLLFAGRGRDDLRNSVVNLILAVVGGSIAFVSFAFGYALIIQRGSYPWLHDLWWNFHQPDPVFGYTIRPNQIDFEFYFQEEDRDVPVSTDGYGFRNAREIGGAPVAGIGDSVIFGQFVTNDELWSAALSRELGVRVANYGVMGYQMWQYNLVADRFARQAGHQLVFYGIFANDLGNDSAAEEDIRLLQHWELWPWRSPISYTLATLLDESPGYQVAEAVRTWSSGSVRGAAEAVEMPYGLMPSCVPWAIGYGNTGLIATRLDRAIELSEQIGYRLLIVTIPSKESVYYEELIPVCGPDAAQVVVKERGGYAFICDYMEERGQLCYDMTDDLRAVADADAELLYFRGDGHLSPHGHQVFADLLAAYIESHGLLD